MNRALSSAVRRLTNHVKLSVSLPQPANGHPVYLISASRDIQKLKCCLEAAGKASIYEYLNCKNSLSPEQLLKINSDKSREPNKGGSAQ